jgi:hypothetical protein
MREGWGGWRGGEAEGSESLLKLMQVNFRNGENFEVCKNICLINEIHEYVPEFFKAFDNTLMSRLCR